MTRVYTGLTIIVQAYLSQTVNKLKLGIMDQIYAVFYSSSVIFFGSLSSFPSVLTS